MSVTIRTKGRPWLAREVSEEEATDLQRMGLVADEPAEEKPAAKKATRSRSPRKKAAPATTTEAAPAVTDTSKEG